MALYRETGAGEQCPSPLRYPSSGADSQRARNAKCSFRSHREMGWPALGASLASRYAQACAESLTTTSAISRVTTFRNFTAGVLPIASNTEFRTANGPAKGLLAAATRILPSVPVVSILQSIGMIGLALMESRQTFSPRCCRDGSTPGLRSYSEIGREWHPTYCWTLSVLNEENEVSRRK